MRYLYLFLYSCIVSISGGIAAFFVSFRWFAVAEALRSLSLDLILLGLLLLLPAKISAALVVVLFIPLLVVALINVLHILTYKSVISAFAIQSILETSSNEATEFLSEYTTAGGVAVAVVTVLLTAFLAAKAFKGTLKIRRSRVVLAAAVLLLAVPAGVAWNKAKLRMANTTYVLADSLLNHRGELERIDKLKEARKNRKFAGVELLDADDTVGRTYIFVIGESANRHHMSLYGYHRETTPEMEKFRSLSMLVFTRAVSAATHTIPSLRQTLLFHDLDGEEDILQARSVVGLCGDAGFDTYWLSNQTANSDGLTGTAVIAGDARIQRFFNRSRNEGQSACYDDALLPALEKVLNAPGRNKAIFLHLIGSHLSYGLRYPRDFTRFSETADLADLPCREGADKKYINEYDNSIAYTDYILGRILDMAAKRSGRNFVVYFSDHGQEVYDTLPIRGQDANRPTRNMFDIPFICWFSDEYRKANPELVAEAEKNLQRPFSLAWFPHTAAELARVRFSGFDASRSLVSPSYAPGPCMIPGGAKYDDLPDLP